YQLLRVQLLAGAKRRTIHLASSTLDARERVEDRFLRQILHGLETDFFFLEIEIRHAPELDRFQEHRDGRQHEVEVLGGRNQREKREDDRHVQPPVDASGCRVVLEVEAEQE